MIKNTYSKLLSVILFFALMAFAGCDDEDNNAAPSLPESNIVELAQGSSDLSILVQALTKFPDLVSTLSNESGSYTVFAPTNDAFSALLQTVGQTSLDDIPESVLRRILEHHVIGGASIASTDLTDGQSATTVLGESISINTVGGVSINQTVNVATADVAANNGIVHIVDAVIVPALETSIVNTIVEPAYFNKSFSVLTQAVVTAGLVETLIDPTANFTLFAPTNAAFEAAGITSLEGLTADDLTPILTYHVLGSEVFASDLPSTEGGFAQNISTLNGDFFLTNNASGVFINGTTSIVAATNAGGALDYNNGVVHVIDRTILPPSQNIVEIALAAGFNRLAEALTEAGIVDVFTGQGRFTVFAPTDAAFDALYQTLGVSGPAELDDATLLKVLQYHVIDGKLFSSDLSNNLSATTLSTDQFTVLINDDGVAFEDNDPDFANPKASATDVLATNGVIHIIDAVLIPVDL